MIFEKKVGNDMIRVQYDDPNFKITLNNEHSKVIKIEAANDSTSVLARVVEFTEISEQRKITRTELKNQVSAGLLNMGFTEN